MTLRKFMDAAYALLYEINEKAAGGIDALAIIDKMSQWGSGGAVQTSPAPTRQNEQAMTQLTAALAGVQNAPTRKPRRA